MEKENVFIIFEDIPENVTSKESIDHDQKFEKYKKLFKEIEEYFIQF